MKTGFSSDELRKILLDRYGKDIEASELSFSGKQYLFSFDADNSVIKIGRPKDNKELLARMMWADDLKAFKDTICEGVPSTRGHLIEEFSFMHKTYCAQMYKIPKGRMANKKDVKPMYFICQGDMLGNIHKASMDQGEMGMKFQIPKMEDIYFSGSNLGYAMMVTEQKDRISYLLERIKEMPATADKYGVCYGDFSMYNQMIDSNNIYLFDFDNSMYAHYMYDIASFFLSVIMSGYMKDIPSEKIVESSIIPWFRVGYSINKNCDSGYWKDISTYLSIVGATRFLDLYAKNKNDDSGFEKRSAMRNIYSEIFMAENVFEGIDMARKTAITMGLLR